MRREAIEARIRELEARATTRRPISRETHKTALKLIADFRARIEREAAAEEQRQADRTAAEEEPGPDPF